MEVITNDTRTDPPARWPHLATRAVNGKLVLDDLVEMGKIQAKRAVRQSYAAAEDYLDNTTHYIKHNPWKSVGLAAGIGLGLGIIAGLVTKSRYAKEKNWQLYCLG